MDYTYEQSNDYPLRILVPSDAVGAIIGKQGSTVKQIKQTTHAKVDVNKIDSPNVQERVISIRGQTDDCIKACKEILRIMYEDAQNKKKTNDIVLKVLAHNNFIGRIIGKGGNIINTIKKDTDTNITVSSINELNLYNTERIISIKGDLEQQIHALEAIYTKLCSAYDNDHIRGWTYPTSSYQQIQQQQQQQQQFMQQFVQQAAVLATTGNQVPSLLPTHYVQPQQSVVQPTSTTNGNATASKYVEQSTMYQPPSYYSPMVPIQNPYYMSYPSSTNNFVPSYPHQYGNLATNGNIHQQAHSQSSLGQLSQHIPAVVETVRLYVPNAVIGAIIGTKGMFIKSIIKNSNASVKISSSNTFEDQNKITDRQVTIVGTPEAQWRSQYYIYDRIRQEGYAGDDEVRLRAEIDFPTALIGRLIGKGGQNLRQLQQSTGAMIKLPEDSQQTTATEVSIKIIGPFPASQFAQRRIQSIIQMNRDLTNASNEDSNNPVNDEFNAQSPNNLNESSIKINGSTISDDAVVASNTTINSDNSITHVEEKISNDEQENHSIEEHSNN